MPLACLAQLDRSHRRHDEVMAELLAAARRLAAGRPEEGDVRTVHDAVAYFQRAVTRHFLDEEGSVFPRLSTRRPELAEQLAALSAEHPAQIALQNAIAQAAAALDGESRPTAGKQLLEIAERLHEQHRSHVTREDEIFVVAHDALTDEDDRDISAEMETRRDRDSENGGGGRRRGGGGGGGGGGRGGGGGGGRRRAEQQPQKQQQMQKAAVAAKTARGKRAPAKTAASKKPAAKKPAAKKPAAKKSAAKKPAAKKSAAKKSGKRR